MAVLFAAQSLLHCLAVFGSALADCAKVSSPTNAAHAAAVKVGLITHSPGNIPLDACDFEAPRGAKLPRWPIAGRNEPDRQHGHVHSLFLPCQEQKENLRKERAALGNAALIPFASCARSMRGECGGIRFDRRLGAHRGFGRLGLLLIPFDRLAVALVGPRPNLSPARGPDAGAARTGAVVSLDLPLRP